MDPDVPCFINAEELVKRYGQMVGHGKITVLRADVLVAAIDCSDLSTLSSRMSLSCLLDPQSKTGGTARLLLAYLSSLSTHRRPRIVWTESTFVFDRGAADNHDVDMSAPEGTLEDDAYVLMGKWMGDIGYASTGVRMRAPLFHSHQTRNRTHVAYHDVTRTPEGIHRTLFRSLAEVQQLLPPPALYDCIKSPRNASVAHGAAVAGSGASLILRPRVAGLSELTGCLATHILLRLIGRRRPRGDFPMERSSTLVPLIGRNWKLGGGAL